MQLNVWEHYIQLTLLKYIKVYYFLKYAKVYFFSQGVFHDENNAFCFTFEVFDQFY